ncbi:MAG: thiamine phosphate synthase [Gemmatimonadota bacterium]|nr:thiamine phosphate synthase [Gemmatimonadota bacterium]
MLDELRLLAIAGPPLVEPAHVVDVCRAAEAGGVTAIQLRVKEASAGDLLRWTEQLCAALSIPVYVNDRSDVALLGNATGVHVGVDDLPPSAVRALAGNALRIGMSVGTPSEADAACGEDVDYWSIGALFATDTKPDAGAPIGLRGFQALAAKATSTMTVLAIGGIQLGNVKDVIAVGAHGVAVSSAVFGSGQVERAARALRTALDSAIGH